MAKQIEVVVIHGSHKHADGVAKVGEHVNVTLAELKGLDPTFSLKKGIGERFATPAAAKKLNLKRQLEEELEGVDEDELDAEEDAADDVAAESAPVEVAATPAKKKSGGKKKEG
jgi:hypothetical protein